MEISPIAGICSVPVLKAQPADLELSAVFDIENTARSGDETYTPSGGRSASGGEDEFNDSLEEDEAEPEARAKSQGDDAGPEISFFA